MKDNLEKSLKRFLKRKMKISLATVVAFLITGFVSYSQEVNITYENGKVNSNGVGIASGNEKDGFVWTNYDIIDGKINISEEVLNKKFSIINNGVIIENQTSPNILENEKIDTVDNFGVIVGNPISASATSENNYGLKVTDDNGKISVQTTGKSKENVNIYGSNYLLVNGVTGDNSNYTASGLTLESLKEVAESHYDEDFGNFSNLILNVVGDNSNGKYNSLNVENNIPFSINNSVINAYKTAVKLEGNSRFDMQKVVINAGQYAILGGEEKDVVNVMTSSKINGNIDLGNGNDTLNINGGSTINGNIILGTSDNAQGNDNLVINNSTVNGNIFTNGDSVKLEEGSRINGKLDIINGNLTLGSNVHINGNLNMSGNKVAIEIGKGTKLGNETILTVNAQDKNLILSYNVNDESDATSLRAQANQFKDFTLNLKDGGNKNVDLRGITGNNTVSNIVGGNGNDTFIIGEGETNLKISDSTTEDNDTLKLSFNTKESTKLNGGYENIENLELALNGDNTLDVSGLKFENIKGGNGNDTFLNVSQEQLTKIKGNGFGDHDVISMDSDGLVADNTTLDDVFGNNGIEELILGAGTNTISLNDLGHINRIDFSNGTNNTIKLGETSENVEYRLENTKVKGNVTFDLQNNIANLGSSSLSGDTITLNNLGGKIGFNNGTVRFELGDGIYFNDGVDTSYKLTLNNITLENSATLETYAFLKISDDKNTLTVKSWNDLGGTSGKEEDYNSLLKDYNKDGKDGITNAFNTWTEQDIVDLVDKGEITNGDKVVGNNDHYKHTLVVNGNINIKGENEEIGKIEVKFDKGLSSKSLVISGNGVSADNTIDFNGSTTIVNTSGTGTSGIDATGFDQNLTLNFHQNGDSKVNIDGIAFGNTTGNNINIGNASNIENIGNITTGESGKAHISIKNIGENSDGFNKILAGANAGNTSVSVTNVANGIDINADYKGSIEFGAGDDNIVVNSNVGNINMGTGNDTVTVGMDKDIIVNVNGGEGNNVFNIGSSNTTLAMEDSNPYDNYKTLSGSLTGFGSINVNKDVKFDSGLKLDGTNTITITIGSGNNLVLGVDYNKVTGGKVTGHAFYNKEITVDNTNGNLVIDVTGANKDTTISLGDTNKPTFENPNGVISSNSSAHEVNFNENGEISVIIKETILGENEAIKYGHLDNIYKSIVSAGKISEMGLSTSTTDKTVEASIQAQLEFYGKIYSTSPYAYSNDISRESAKTINNNVLDSRFKAEKGEWIHYGAIIGQGQDTDYSYNGAGHYKVDIGTMNVNVDSDIYGAYYMGEYGHSEKLSLGYVVAGNKSDATIGESSLDGNGFYLGTYAKYNVNKIDLIAGFGYQHNSYDADRKVSNKYQSMSTSEKYGDNTLTAYAGAKYTHQLREDVTFEPYARLNLTHVMQDSISEQDKGDLSISVDSQDFTAVDTELGFNFVKTMVVEKGKVNLFAGMGAEFSVTGYDTDYLTARINGASKSFEIISDENDRVKGKVSIGAEFEQVNGVFYNAKGTLVKSDNTDDYNFEIGIGYRF